MAPGGWRCIAGLVYPVRGIQGLPLAARVRASSQPQIVILLLRRRGP
jgi:hypothetical protein